MDTRLRRITNINTFPKTLEDYEAFCAQHPDTTLTRKQHTQIIKEGLKTIAHMVLTDVTGFKLPRSMGYLAVTKFKPNNRRKDHKSSKEFGKEIPYLNLHTFGYIMYVRWFKPHRNFANKRLYSFDACRDMDRQITEHIAQGMLYEQLDRDFYYALVRECTPDWKLDQQRTKLSEKLARQQQSRQDYKNRMVNG